MAIAMLAIAKLFSLAKANSRLLTLLGTVLALAFIFTAFGAHEFHRGAETVRAAARKAVAEAEARNTIAVRKADEQRAKDQQATVQLEKDLTHAYASTPDSKPSAARLALGCRRLHNAGRDISKLPECGGLDPAAKASPIR